MIAVNVVGLLLLGPILRILKRNGPSANEVLWVAAGFFVLNRLRDIGLLSAPVTEQVVVLLITGGGAVALAWLWRRGRLVIGSYKVPELLVWLGVGTLIVSFLFGTLGYMRLARLLSGGMLRSAYTAVGVYVALLVVLGVFAYLLRIWPLAELHMVSAIASSSARRGYPLVGGGGDRAGSDLHWFALLDEAETLRTVLGYRVTPDS
jgi:hypothetical protein